MSAEDRIRRLLSDPINRSVVTVLASQTQPMTVDDLASWLVSSEGVADEIGEVQPELLEISLHHNHLPRLNDAGLLAYDSEGRTVRRVARETVDPEWGEIDIVEDLLAKYTDQPSSSTEIGILDGRENVYDHARNMADEATDELFLIYTSVELLDQQCLPYAKRAIDRGVDFHAGATSQKAREFFRSCLPAATVWEPQMDWMRKTNTYPKISRLIVADRKQVVVGLWTNPNGDSDYTEIGMIGAGATNPLVVLVRELLGPRLDHLDYQSDDFLETLPFES